LLLWFSPGFCIVDAYVWKPVLGDPIGCNEPEYLDACGLKIVMFLFY
jgi:hypothetical protein